MKKIIYLNLFMMLSGCASTPKDISEVRVYNEPKTYRADCKVGEVLFSEPNLKLVKEQDDKFIMTAEDGKTLGLPQRDCFLSQMEGEASFAEDEPKQKWVKCKLDKFSFVSDSLIYIADEKWYYKLKRRDGQVWILPRHHCAIYQFNQGN